MKLVLTVIATLTLIAGMMGERPSGRETRTSTKVEVA